MTDSATTRSATRYDAVAKSLHWLIALAIIFMLVLGWTMDDLTGTQKYAAFQLHKSVGITILVLSLARLGWRLAHHFPALPDSMKPWEKLAAHGAHIGLYVLMIGMPLTGWALVSTSPLNTVLYGVIPLPHLPVLADLPNRHEVGHLFGETHGVLAYILAVLVVAHAGAAWKHHLFNRDEVLLRMAPNFAGGVLKCLRGEKS